MMTFYEACAAIVANRNQRALNYAVNYAAAGMAMTDANEQRVQALYILNNISRWRGAVAAEVRATLKRVGEVQQ